MKLLTTLLVGLVSTSFGKVSTLTESYVSTSMDIIYAEPSNVSPASVGSHPEIKGFDRVFSFDKPWIRDFWYEGEKDDNSDDKKMGYVSWDLDLYTTPFTDKSMLLLVHTQTSATSGNVANSTGSTGYYNRVDLMKFGVKISVPRITDTQNGYHTGSVKPLDYWPKSGEDSPSGTVSHSSSFGLSADFDANLEAGVDAGGVSIKAGIGPSISLSFGVGSTITSADPHYSSQEVSTGINEYSYYIEYEKIGKITYTMNTYALYEIGYNVSGFNKNGFVIRYSTEMKVGENVGYWILEKTYTDIYTYELRWNLGYNPEYVDYYA